MGCPCPNSGMGDPAGLLLQSWPQEKIAHGHPSRGTEWEGSMRNEALVSLSTLSMA